MPRLVKLLAACGLLLPALCHAIGEVPLEEAMAEARAQGRHLYVAFLGEGWSLSSGKFRREVLDSPEFKGFAGTHLVYFPVLARRSPPLDRKETAILQSWTIHFDIKSYPTLILLGPDGQEVLRHGYRDIPAAEYVALLGSLIPAAEPARPPQT